MAIYKLNMNNFKNAYPTSYCENTIYLTFFSSDDDDGAVDVCNDVPDICGIGTCIPTGTSHVCMCDDGTTQEEPCKAPSIECGGVLAGQ